MTGSSTRSNRFHTTLQSLRSSSRFLADLRSAGRQPCRSPAVPASATITPGAALVVDSCVRAGRSVRSRHWRIRPLLVVAVIWACDQEDCDTSELGPGDEPDPTVSVTPSSITIAKDASAEIIGSQTGGRGAPEAVRWVSTDATVATVMQGTGFAATVTGLKAGTALIIGSSRDVQPAVRDTCVVTVVEVAGVVIDPSSSALAVGQNAILRATATDAAGSTLPIQLQWQSSAPAIASISPAIGIAGGAHTVAAVAPGNVVITARSDPGHAGTATVMVDAPVALVTVSPATLAIPLGQAMNLTATATDASGATVNTIFTWLTSNATIASVTPDATTKVASVAGLALGSATIQVVAGTATGTASVEVQPVGPDPAILEGFMRDETGQPLPGMTIRANPTAGGAGFRTTTDAQGYYIVDVSPGGQLNVGGQGVVGLRFGNNENEVVLTTAGQTVRRDLSWTTGYHFEVTTGFIGVQAPAGGSFQIQFGYRAWNRIGAPNAQAHVAVGVEATSVVAHFIGNAGPFTNPTGSANGTATLTLTAPATPGTYGIYAHHVSSINPSDAVTRYIQRYPSAEQFIRIGTVAVQ